MNAVLPKKCKVLRKDDIIPFWRPYRLCALPKKSRSATAGRFLVTPTASDWGNLLNISLLFGVSNSLIIPEKRNLQRPKKKFQNVTKVCNYGSLEL